MSDNLILLCAVNSTYQHTSFGLRYLKANLKEYTNNCKIQEFTISQSPKDIAEKILNWRPEILGIGVYIWNTSQVLEIIKIIKKIDPRMIIVLGGPEISYETENQEHINYANFIIQGEADLSFYELCSKILQKKPLPQKIIPFLIPDISKIELPYNLYSQEDIQNRVVYVEASRGCPYKCEYCLSSLDKAVRNFDLNLFLDSMKTLMEKGVRDFKFVDRTFNLNPKISQRILEFFLGHIDKNLFLHFEMVPDRLPEELKGLIQKFPVGCLQFEVGIQTLNDQVSQNVSRKQNVEKIKENFLFLKNHTHVHTHADLIVGLPGENLNSFKDGFNTLMQMEPDEIQIGLLKRLKGTPITRHDQSFEMIYDDGAPYQILQNKNLSFKEVQLLARFSKHWDMISNSGNWKNFMTLLKSKINFCEKTRTTSLEVFNFEFDLFERFLKLSLYLNQRHQNAFGISMPKLAESLFYFLLEELKLSPQQGITILLKDYCFSKSRDIPAFLKERSEHKVLTSRIYEDLKNLEKEASAKNLNSLKKRQLQHIRNLS